MDARHNSNKLGELTSFPITFVLSGCGNQSITLHSTPGKDNRCGGKIHEIRTNYNLVACPDEFDPTQRLCDTSTPTRCREGEYDGELFFWARMMYKTITPDVCKTRHMTPLPPTLILGEDELASKLVRNIKTWFDKNTAAWEPIDATPPCIIVRAVTKALGRIDGTVWAACGMGDKHQAAPPHQWLSGGFAFLSWVV